MTQDVGGEEGTDARTFRCHWNFYRTEGGRKEAKEYIMSLPDRDRSLVFAEMEEVCKMGLKGLSVRHLRGDIHEVRIDGVENDYRILFATEGHFSHILLALEAFPKKTQKTPDRRIKVAEARLADWRSRATEND